ncbi:MAG: amino acid ABC transporter permease [Rhodobacteraceae bacterium]|nr:amino acid ABC transporter permease [Paracoccaceae bacterium]TVR48083.1 MAG: amino acid ABC transporter permease [Paracoccaceae bacterium]
MSNIEAHTVAYVRDTMLPEQTPPITEKGAVKWLRENLFSGWLNSVLTVLSLLVIWWALAAIGPWLLNTIWNAGSLRECREILDGTPGACFAVINDRWHQLLFGFYPSQHYWRPTLAFVLLLASLAPVLFTNLPRKLLYVSAAYPFVAYHLLWGGSIWLPVSAALGFVAGFVAFVFARRVNGLLAVFAAVLAPIFWWLFLAQPFNAGLSSVLPIGLEFVRSDRFGGFLISLVIGVTGISLSLPLGILLALGRQSDMVFVKSVCVIFIEFIRGVPLITLLFTASLLLNYFLPPGTSFDLILRVIIMVTLFAAAYMAEVIRGGLAALPRGQYEAADALGLDYWKAQRLIIMPQALKISIPGIVNTFIGLFKDTTLVVFIGLLDPIGLSNAIRADTDWNGIYWELFIFIGALFFLFCFGISRYSMYLERKLKTDHR